MNVIVSETRNPTQNVIAHISKDNVGYYKFGNNDELINEIIDIVNCSGTARSCVGALSRFILGNGLNNADLGKGKANAMQSHNSAISELALNVAYAPCATFRVLYSMDGLPARYYPVPIHQLRRKGKKTFLYNELLGYKNRMRTGDRWLSMFDPNELPASRMARMQSQIDNYGEQVGDIVYHYRKGVGRYYDIYPIPDYYAGLPDIESDAGISILERRNIKRGWKTSVIISTGPLDKNVVDQNGRTQYDKFVETVKRFADEDAAVALHLEGATNEAKPEVKTLDIASVLDATDRATDRVGRKVCRHFDVPPVLVGFSTPGQLGNNQELKNTMDLFRLTVKERQQLITEALTLVFPGLDWSLTTLALWDQPVETPGVTVNYQPQVK